MRMVAKLYPGIFEQGADAKPGDTIGVITGLVEQSAEKKAYGGFHYKTPYTDEATTSRLLQLPDGCDDLQLATKANPIPVGFLIVVGAYGKPFMRRYNYEPA